jgi:hypothetical protein
MKRKRARKVARKVVAAARRGDKLACALLAEAAARSRTKTRRGRKRNPVLVTLHNPTPKAFAEGSTGRKRYETFHGVPPPRFRNLGPAFPDCIALGDLREVVYKPTIGHRKGPAFFHRFGKGAKLAASLDGTRLFIVPGKGKPFRFDPERGIVG